MDEFKALLNKGLEAFIKFNCHKWLSDDRKIKTFDEIFIQWAYKWESKIMKQGWKAWACIIPEIEVQKEQMLHNMNHIQTIGVRVKSFENVETAMAWLKEQ